jgi:hypothetical protein
MKLHEAKRWSAILMLFFGFGLNRCDNPVNNPDEPEPIIINEPNIQGHVYHYGDSLWIKWTNDSTWDVLVIPSLTLDNGLTHYGLTNSNAINPTKFDGSRNPEFGNFLWIVDTLITDPATGNPISLISNSVRVAIQPYDTPGLVLKVGSTVFSIAR